MNHETKPSTDVPVLGRREALEALALVGAAASCSSSSSDASAVEAKAPYPAWNETTANGYWRKLPDGTSARYVTRRAEDVVVAGKTFGRYVMERAGGGAATAAEMWIGHDSEQKVTLAGASYTSDTAVKLGLPRGGSVTATTPLTIDLAAPVGRAQPFDTRVVAAVSTTAQTAEVGVTGSLTIVEKDIAVETPSGVVSGCSRIEVAGAVPLLFGTNLVSARGQIWISPSLGVVKAQLDEPLSGFGMSADSTRSSHDLGNGYASVEAVGVVGSGVSRYELSTTEASGGALDADKETHAKLYVEIRWVDDTLAKSDKKPYVDVELGTLLGVFPASLEQSPISLFHPEENGKGYVTWIAYANEAAKNEPGSNGIAYHTTIRYDSGLTAIRVSSRIVYKRIAVPT